MERCRQKKGGRPGEKQNMGKMKWEKESEEGKKSKYSRLGGNERREVKNLKREKVGKKSKRE